MKLKKHKNRRPWTYAIGELVKISDCWSQGIYVSNSEAFGPGPLAAENSILLSAGAIGIVVENVLEKVK